MEAEVGAEAVKELVARVVVEELVVGVVEVVEEELVARDVVEAAAELEEGMCALVVPALVVGAAEVEGTHELAVLAGAAVEVVGLQYEHTIRALTKVAGAAEEEEEELDTSSLAVVLCIGCAGVDR